MRVIPGGNEYNTSDLRKSLIADLAALREGSLSGSDARTRAYLAKQIIDSMKVDIVAAAMRIEHLVPLPLLEHAA